MDSRHILQIRWILPFDSDKRDNTLYRVESKAETTVRIGESGEGL